MPEKQLDGILVQFILTEKQYKALPEKLLSIDDESYQGYIDRVSAEGNGVQIIPPAQNRPVGVDSLREQLESLGYSLVSGYTQRRPLVNQTNDSGWIVRFCFLPHAAVDAEYDISPNLAPELDKLAKMAFWHLCAYNNPNRLSLNFAYREQRYEKEDESRPKLARLRDDDGHKVGEPVPIRPVVTLEFVDGTPVLTPVK